MIDVSIYTGEDGRKRKFILDGHADYGEKGKDIVCASVSSLAIATVNALSASKIINLQTGDGFIYCEVMNPSRLSDAFIEVLKVGIEGIETEYSEYVKLHLLNE